MKALFLVILFSITLSSQEIVKPNYTYGANRWLLNKTQTFVNYSYGANEWLLHKVSQIKLPA